MQELVQQMNLDDYDDDYQQQILPFRTRKITPKTKIKIKKLKKQNYQSFIRYRIDNITHNTHDIKSIENGFSQLDVLSKRTRRIITTLNGKREKKESTYNKQILIYYFTNQSINRKQFYFDWIGSCNHSTARL